MTGALARTNGRAATASSILNLVLYQLGWFACVLGGAGARGALGAMLALGLIGVHVALADRPLREGALVAAAGLIGWLVETVHTSLGVLQFAGGHDAGPVPIWVIALWMQFATVLHYSLRWLAGRLRLAAIAGLAGGPLAFLAGERLGAAHFGEPRLLSMLVVGAGWAVALPLLTHLADRWPASGVYRPFTRIRSVSRAR